MQAPVACETQAWRSFLRLSGSLPSAWFWAWSWDPLRFARRQRRTTSAPPGQYTRQGQTPKPASAAPSHRSNAPFRPESQSFLSKIVAHFPQSLPTVFGACLRIQRRFSLAPLDRPVTLQIVTRMSRRDESDLVSRGRVELWSDVQ